jgi:GTP-binding protein HflX
MLFATLDPTLRAVDLPHGHRVIVSDTVGFISDLPTMLVAAFRATLEEVIEADIILHVRDISHQESTAQSEDVVTILNELGIDAGNDPRLIEVWNKIDRLAPDARTTVANQAERRPAESRPVLVSAQTSEGIAGLSSAIEARLSRERQIVQLVLDPSDGSGLSWLYRHTEVLSRNLENGQLHVTVRGSAEQTAQVRAKFQEATSAAH